MPVLRCADGVYVSVILRQQILHNLPMHIGPAEANALMELGQAFVVNAQQAQLEMRDGGFYESQST